MEELLGSTAEKVRAPRWRAGAPRDFDSPCGVLPGRLLVSGNKPYARFRLLVKGAFRKLCKDFTERKLRRGLIKMTTPND